MSCIESITGTVSTHSATAVAASAAVAGVATIIGAAPSSLPAATFALVSVADRHAVDATAVFEKMVMMVMMTMTVIDRGHRRYHRRRRHRRRR